MNYKIYGTFTKSKGFIYRTNTFIQFGESKKIIGSCVLCNPGSAKLDNQSEQNRLEEYIGNDDYVIHGEVKVDNTMTQLRKILKGTESIEKNGRFLIYNLFTLRDPKMKDAIKAISHPNINKELLYKDYEDFKESQVNIPWILIGWSCEKNANLKKTKIKWLKDITENKIINVGWKHEDNPNYYHPLPQIHSKQIEYVDYIISKLEKLSVKA